MTTHPTDEALGRYFDHDLPSEERKEVAHHLETCPACTNNLADANLLRGQLVNSWRPRAYAHADAAADEMFAAIEAQLAKPQLRALPGGATPSAAAKPRSNARAMTWGAVSLGALAAAASVLFAIRAGGGDEQARDAKHRKERVGYAVNAPAPQPNAAKPALVERVGSKVVEVDFGHRVGSILETTGKSGSALAVVWINENSMPSMDEEE